MAVPQQKYPMDTCHSWLIFLSAFLISFLAFGQLMTFGVYFVTFSEYFQLDKKTTGMIGAVCFAVTSMTGPVAGVLQRRFGARAVIMVGGLLSSIGMITSYFAQDFWHLYLSYGVLLGLGYGLAATPAVSILPEYFEKHRYLVTTLLSIGGSLGTFVLAPFTWFMIETYTWRGSMLINAGLCLQIVVLGSIMRSRSTDQNADVRALLEVSMLMDCRYVMLLLDGALFGGASFVVLSTLTDLAIGRGLTTWESATLISVSSLSTTLSRVLASSLSSLKCLDRTLLYATTTLSGCAGVIGCVFAYDFWAFAIAVFIFGFSFGIKTSQLVNVILDLVGVRVISVAIGYFMFALGFGGFVAPLFAGWIADHYGADKAFVLMFFAILLGFCCCCVILVLRWKHNRNAVEKSKEAGQEEREALDAAADRVVPME